MSENETTHNTNGTTEPLSATPTPTTAEWRAGSGRFAGMTAEQILGLAEGQAVVLDKFNQPTPVAPEVPRNRFDFDIPDDQFVEGRHVKQLLQQVQNQGAPVDQGARQQLLALTINTLREKYKEEFKRWLPEIQAEIAKLPQDYWNLDTLSTCVDIVKSRHIDELVAERATRLAGESHPTIRSGSSGGSGGVSQSHASIFETGDPGLLSQLRAAGITDEVELRRACEGTGVSPENFVKEFAKYGKGAIVRG